MMTTGDINHLRLTCEELHIPIPTRVLDAEALITAAAAHLDKVRAEVAPDLASATAATVGKLADAAAAYEGHEDRERVARETLAQVQGGLEDAWREVSGGVREALRKPFDTAAAAFVKAADALVPVTPTASGNGRGYVVDTHRAITSGLHAEYQAYVESAARMKQIAQARDVLDSGAARLYLGITMQHNDYERVSRFAAIEAQASVLRLPTVGIDTYEPRWWNALAHLPGVTLRWQDDIERNRPLATLPKGA